MASLLRELLHDARQRADEIVQSLETLAHGSPAVEAYGKKIGGIASHAKRLIEGLIVDSDLDDPSYSSNFFREYCHFARLLRSLEDLPLLVLKRFGKADQQATDLMEAICRESHYPYAAPICAAMSSQYFWTIPDMDLVFVPCLEPDHVLGLPDIYHELGHILLFREKKRLEYHALEIVDEYYDRLLSNGKRQNWPRRSLAEIEGYHHNWRRSWLLEFGSDLIATYLVGPSFGWCNIRTATNLGGELFIGNDSHPADDARAIAIGMMLRKIGCEDSDKAIQTRWRELVLLAKEVAPQRYELAYPDALLEELAQFFRDQCEALGLRQFDRSSRDETPVATTIDVCWTEFRNQPDTYASYEVTQLQQLLAKIQKC